MSGSRDLKPARAGIVAVVVGVMALYAGFFVVAFALRSSGAAPIALVGGAPGAPAAERLPSRVAPPTAVDTPTPTDTSALTDTPTPTNVTTPTNAPTSTPTPTPTSTRTPAPTDVATDTPTNMATEAATAIPPVEETPLPPTSEASPVPTVAASATMTPEPPTPRPLPPGVVLDFEEMGRWRRGDEPYGTLTQTQERSHEGSYAARLDYDMPAVEKNYVVFLRAPAAPIPGRPAALTAWVYGDGSGHYLNAWIEDSEGEVRQFTFGQIQHADAWQLMTLPLDVGAPWPQGHISGPDNGRIDYPIALYALVLDAVPRADVAYQGTIYLDEIAVLTGTPPATAPVAAAATAVPPTPAPAWAGHIVFATGGGRTNIAVVDVAARTVRSLFSNGRQPDVRADGRVVFDGIGGGKENLITVNLDGGGEIITGMHPEDSYPSWSPSGESVVFDSTLQGDGVERIYIQWDMTRAGEPALLRVDGRDALGRAPTWMQTWRIAFSGCDYWGSGSHCGIWTVNSDGSGQPTQLTERMDDRSTDSFGNQLLYASTVTGNWDLFLTTDGGGAGRNLTNSPDHEVGGTFAPDGRAIAFLSNRGGTWAIWVMNADGSGQQKLIDVPDGVGERWAEERLAWGP